MKNYNIKTGKMEIIKILETSMRLDGNILWQNVDDQRVVHKMNVANFDIKDGTFTIMLHDGEKRIQKELPTYVKLNFRKSIFKVEVVEINDRMITVKIPDEVMATEGRKVNRRRFTTADKKKITLKAHDFSGIFKNNYEFQIIDLSSSGMALILNDKEVDQLYNAKKIELIALGKTILMNPIECLAIYSHTEDEETKRMGLIFIGELDQSVIGEFAS